MGKKKLNDDTVTKKDFYLLPLTHTLVKFQHFLLPQVTPTKKPVNYFFCLPVLFLKSLKTHICFFYVITHINIIYFVYSLSNETSYLSPV